MNAVEDSWRLESLFVGGVFESAPPSFVRRGTAGEISEVPISMSSTIDREKTKQNRTEYKGLDAQYVEGY